MSHWYDADDEPFGEWEPCSEAEYIAGLNALTDPVVFSGRTEVGQSRAESGLGPPYVNRCIVSEWGERGAAAPVVRCDDRWDSFGERDHSHYRFAARRSVLLHDKEHSE